MCVCVCVSSHPSAAQPLQWQLTWRASLYPPRIPAPQSAHLALSDADPKHESHSYSTRHGKLGKSFCNRSKKRVEPVPERGCVGRCSAPRTDRLFVNWPESSDPSGTGGSCWHSPDSCRSNLHETSKQEGVFTTSRV